MTPSPPQISPPVFRLKAPRQPMLWAAIFYSCGIVAGVYAWRPTLWWIVAAAAFACAAAYFAMRRSHLGWAIALGALFLAGALHLQTRDAATHLDTSIQPYADRQDLQVIAHVTRDGRLQAGGFNEIRQTVDLETEQIQTATGQIASVHSGIRLAIYSPRPNSASPEDSDSGSSSIRSRSHASLQVRRSPPLLGQA